MNTPKSLLALAESPEGQEQVRIITAQFDGWTEAENIQVPSCSYSGAVASADGWVCPVRGIGFGDFEPPNYPTSLNAIFAAEKRLGLHDFNNYDMRVFWYHQADHLSQLQTGIQLESHDIAFVSILDRCICFILTAQHYRDNHEQ